MKNDDSDGKRCDIDDLDHPFWDDEGDEWVDPLAPFFHCPGASWIDELMVFAPVYFIIPGEKGALVLQSERRIGHA